MASARDKRSGAIYKRREALESKFDQDFEAEQRILKLEREKQAKNAPASSNLMMTCDDEDPFADLNNATIVNVLKMMTTMSRQIGQLTKKVDTIQKEVDDVKTRLLHVELALHATLSMVENVKDLVTFSGLGTEIFPFMPDFDFNPISTEEELNELNDKLGTDAEYMTNLTNWLNSKIQKEDPNHRLTGALELVFRREFLPQCSWKGRGFPGPKIPMSAQTHILELFRVVGSNRLITLTDALVGKFFMKKLPHAKERLKQKGFRSSAYNVESQTSAMNLDPLGE